ncbi:MAG TPA: Crp/Fnr family transcriptional regulator [Cytophagales bacterium]|nr:Crp/Fnr family transcriptional regulator [Cytophagales bacterium]
MNKTLETLQSRFSMPAQKAIELCNISKSRKLLRNEMFISAGCIPKKFGFLIKGLFRYVYTNENGVEFTKGLITEYWFISSYSAMIAQTPSYFSVEALEDATLLEINYSKWLDLRESDPFWYKFLLRFVEQGFIIKEKRERELLLLDAETRYRNFLKDYPGMERRVKQHIIASFLGIKPESLSRIRKKVLS